MIGTLLNPDGLDGTAYVGFLNRCFPGQWNPRSYEWYVRRAFNGRPADLIVRAEQGRILAGLACCYRQLRDVSGATVEVLSAVATLPEQRRRGHLIALLDAALDTCKARGCAALLGFVTRDNISGHGLLRLGAYAIPSYYIASTARWERPRCLLTGRPKATAATDLVRMNDSRRASEHVRFLYTDDEDWRGQYIARPHPVRAVRVAHDVTALVETVDHTDRNQRLDCPPHKTTASLAALAAASAAAGRRLFLHSMDPRAARAARRLGLRVRDGSLVMMPVDAAVAPLTTLATARWHVESGDRV